MYLGKKQQVEHSLGILQLSQNLNDTYCTLFSDNFFNSPSLVETLCQRGIYGIGTVRKDRKHMPSMVPDKAMKRGDMNFNIQIKLYHANGLTTELCICLAVMSKDLIP